MYTRCPSCRAEISFEPPANMETLPDGYKHRIKCPSCGVTIGVKINKIDTTVTQPVYTPQNPYASSPAPVYNAGAAEAAPAAKKAVAKKSGISRNVFMMICSLLFVALSVVGYLMNANIISIPSDFLWANSFSAFAGIDRWADLITNTSTFVGSFYAADGAMTVASFFVGFVKILPMIMFTLAGIIFVVDLICACCKKYGRATNFLFAFVVGGIGVVMLFYPYIMGESDGNLLAYFKDFIIGGQGYVLIGSAALGLVYLVASCICLKSLKIKRA